MRMLILHVLHETLAAHSSG